MNKLMDIGNALVDRSADEMIGAVMVALALALAVTAIGQVIWRNRKPALTAMTVLLITGNLAAMAIAVGYTGRRMPGSVIPPDGDDLPLAGAFDGDAREVLLGELISKADADHDGLITEDEATRAASALLVKAAGSTGRSVDARTLESVIASALAFPPRTADGGVRAFRPAYIGWRPPPLKYESGGRVQRQ